MQAFRISSRALLLALIAGMLSVLAIGPALAQSQHAAQPVSAAAQAASLPKELLNRDWKLLELQRGPGSTQSATGVNVTIRFSADGKVSGSGGCNSFGGSYTAGANRSIQFSPLVSTLMACTSALMNTFEQEYLGALQSASSYTLDGTSRFQLSYNNGQGRLSFIAATPQEQLCFSETPYCVSGRFLSYWRQNGGLAVFGLPISEQTTENNLPVQYFERQRFELHAENTAPYDVLLGRLGDELLRQRSIDWSTLPKASGAEAGCRYFPATQHNICDQRGGPSFLSYWSANGLEFDNARGKSLAESLALFGLPLTEPMTMTLEGQPFLVQWFERARFEWHPDNAAAYRVLLGRLGVEVQSPPLDQTPVVPPAPSPPDRTLTSSDDGATIGLKTGQMLAVRLDSNPTTGYSWQIGQVDAAVLKQQGQPQFIRPADAPPGAGGAQVFLFTAVAGGSTTLTLVYKRSFEPDVAPVQTFTVHVTVDASAASVGAPQL